MAAENLDLFLTYLMKHYS